MTIRNLVFCAVSVFGMSAPAFADGARAVPISITEKGFEPERVEVKKGEEVTLVFTRKTDATCAKKVVVETDGGKVEKKLPLGEAVAVTARFARSGELHYACGMGMLGGTIVVK